MKIGKVHLLSPVVVSEYDAENCERVLFSHWCLSSSQRTTIFQHMYSIFQSKFQHAQHHIPTFSHASRRKRIISNAWPWALLQRPRTVPKATWPSHGNRLPQSGHNHNHATIPMDRMYMSFYFCMYVCMYVCMHVCMPLFVYLIVIFTIIYIRHAVTAFDPCAHLFALRHRLWPFYHCLHLLLWSVYQ